MKQMIVFILSIWMTSMSYSQGTTYTVKLGYSGSFEKMGNIARDPLFAPSFGVEIEDFSDQNASSVYAALGYYRRGASSNISRVRDDGGSFKDVSGQFALNNLGLTLGVRGKKQLQEYKHWFYSVGIRGEYNLSDNFDDYQTSAQQNIFFPADVFINSIVYGITAGTGIEFQLSPKFDGVLEFNFYPDISKQYDQPAISNVPDPFNPGGTRNLAKRDVRNVSAEITFGIRLVKLR